MWKGFGATGLIAAFLLSAGERTALAQRVGPVLVFLVAVTVLADIAALAGVFDALAAAATRAGRGHTRWLFVLLMVLATGTTILFSLDTTAVLVTPIVIAVARSIDVPAWPFALAVLWLANTGSLLLPVSNLTNLLAMHGLGLATHDYTVRMWRPALVAIGVTMLALLLLFRRVLAGRHRMPPRPQPHDRVFLVGAGLAIACFVALLAANATPALAAGIAAGLALAVAVVRGHPSQLRSLFPWRLIVTTVGMFLTVAAVADLGLRGLVMHLLGGHPTALAVAAGSAALANVLNNLPAYLLVEQVVPHAQLPAVLLGTNLGPIVLPWASLATLLWAERVRRAGEQVQWRTVMFAGAVLAPLLIVSSVLALPSA